MEATEQTWGGSRAGGTEGLAPSPAVGQVSCDMCPRVQCFSVVLPVASFL